MRYSRKFVSVSGGLMVLEERAKLGAVLRDLLNVVTIRKSRPSPYDAI